MNDICTDIANREHLPLIINQRVIDKFIEASREEIDGASDALLLHLFFYKCHLNGTDWDVDTVSEELGFSRDRTEELIEFLIMIDLIVV